MAKTTWKPGTMLFPVPPVMVTCGNAEKQNVLTVAWTGIINSEPPLTYISVRPSRYSHQLIEETQEFVINLVNLPLAKACDFCGVKSGKNTDKFKEMELELEPCSKVNVPMLKASPIALECKVIEVKHFNTHDMFIAEIVNVNVDDKYIEDDGRLAIEKAGLLAFAHGRYYTLGRDLGAFGFSVDKTKENKTKPRKSKFQEILKIEEQIKEGTLKIKEKRTVLSKDYRSDKSQNRRKGRFNDRKSVTFSEEGADPRPAKPAGRRFNGKRPDGDYQSNRFNNDRPARKGKDYRPERHSSSDHPAKSLEKNPDNNRVLKRSDNNRSKKPAGNRGFLGQRNKTLFQRKTKKAE